MGDEAAPLDPIVEGRQLGQLGQVDRVTEQHEAGVGTGAQHVGHGAGGDGQVALVGA